MLCYLVGDRCSKEIIMLCDPVGYRVDPTVDPNPNTYAYQIFQV